MRGWAISTQFPLNKASDCCNTTDIASSVAAPVVWVVPADVVETAAEGMVVEEEVEEAPVEEEMVEPVVEGMVVVAVV